MSSARVAAGLADLLGPGAVLTDAADQAKYLHDWRDRHRGTAQCVVLPRTTEEVAAVLRHCNSLRVPVFHRAATPASPAAPRRTAAARPSSSAPSGSTRCATIDPLNNSMVAEAGCVLASLQQAASEADRLFPLSLAAEGTCQIGGNLATNAGGINVLRYGNARDLCSASRWCCPTAHLVRPARPAQGQYRL